MIGIVIDFETTDLLSSSPDFMAQPGIVQIGAIKIDEHFNELETLNLLVNPEVSKWSDRAMAVHGITPETVKDAPTFFETGRVLSKFVLGCEIWGGYNTYFDRKVLWWQLLRYGLETSFPWPPEEADVMKYAHDHMEMQGKRGTKNPKLSEIYETLFGHGFENAHDALADVRATIEVWRKLSQ